MNHLGSPRTPPDGAPHEPDARARLTVTWAGARDGLWDWDLATDEIHFSPRWKEIVGCVDGEIGGTPDEWFRRVHPRDLEALKGALRAHLEGRTPRLEREFRMLHKDGSWRWAVCSAVASRDGKLLGGSLADITQHKQAEDRLLLEAFHDSLTGLPNRALFLDRLGQALSRTRRRPESGVAVLYLDLDRFRTINDSLGPDAGDQLLLVVTERLKKLVRLGDTVARLGGDKFAFLLDGVAGPRAAISFAEEIERSLRLPLTLGGHEVLASCSTGIALASERHRRPMDLLNDAVTAMHRAKEDPTSSHQLFDPEMNAAAKGRLQLEADLRHAMERKEFLLHYQPIISFASGCLSGFEALLRWRHPDRGFVSPDVFIPIAEETGMIVPLGNWVLDEACKQMARWRGAYPGCEGVAVAVNLSARQFGAPGLVDEVAQTLRRTGLEATALKLEMTESTVMARTRENKATLHALRRLGVRLLIDDFGTGYSSLASLHSFPLDTLKIDRSFVSRMEYEDEKAEIVRTILTLARNLGMDAVAEGVETAEQLSMLRSLECAHGQGYFFSTAVDHESAGAWLRDRPRF